MLCDVRYIRKRKKREEQPYREVRRSKKITINCNFLTCLFSVVFFVIFWNFKIVKFECEKGIELNWILLNSTLCRRRLNIFHRHHHLFLASIQTSIYLLFLLVLMLMIVVDGNQRKMRKCQEINVKMGWVRTT